MPEPEGESWRSEVDVGRYELHDIQGKIVLLDTVTGNMWLLRGTDGKAVLVPVSSARKESGP